MTKKITFNSPEGFSVIYILKGNEKLPKEIEFYREIKNPVFKIIEGFDPEDRIYEIYDKYNSPEDIRGLVQGLDYSTELLILGREKMITKDD